MRHQRYANRNHSRAYTMAALGTGWHLHDDQNNWFFDKGFFSVYPYCRALTDKGMEEKGGIGRCYSGVWREREIRTDGGGDLGRLEVEDLMGGLQV